MTVPNSRGRRRALRTPARRPRLVSASALAVGLSLATPLTSAQTSASAPASGPLDAVTVTATRTRLIDVVTLGQVLVTSFDTGLINVLTDGNVVVTENTGNLRVGSSYALAGVPAFWAPYAPGAGVPAGGLFLGAHGAVGRGQRPARAGLDGDPKHRDARLREQAEADTGHQQQRGGTDRHREYCGRHRSHQGQMQDRPIKPMDATHHETQHHIAFFMGVTRQNAAGQKWDNRQ
jgi:hypothetical protein